MFAAARLFNKAHKSMLAYLEIIEILIYTIFIEIKCSDLIKKNLKVKINLICVQILILEFVCRNRLFRLKNHVLLLTL